MSQSDLEINRRDAPQAFLELRPTKGKAMFFARMLIVSMAIFAAGAASAQDRAQGDSACGRDASRVCKKVINDGDMAVLGCLKENRARLRPACVKYLQDQGQL